MLARRIEASERIVPSRGPEALRGRLHRFNRADSSGQRQKPETLPGLLVANASELLRTLAADLASALMHGRPRCAAIFYVELNPNVVGVTMKEAVRRVAAAKRRLLPHTYELAVEVALRVDEDAQLDDAAGRLQ